MLRVHPECPYCLDDVKDMIDDDAESYIAERHAPDSIAFIVDDTLGRTIAECDNIEDANRIVRSVNDVERSCGRNVHTPGPSALLRAVEDSIRHTRQISRDRVLDGVCVLPVALDDHTLSDRELRLTMPDSTEWRLSLLRVRKM